MDTSLLFTRKNILYPTSQEHQGLGLIEKELQRIAARNDYNRDRPEKYTVPLYGNQANMIRLQICADKLKTSGKTTVLLSLNTSEARVNHCCHRPSAENFQMTIIGTTQLKTSLQSNGKLDYQLPKASR